MTPREVPQMLPEPLLSLPRWSLGPALCRAVLSYHPARPALRDPEPHLEPLNGYAAAVRGHHFPSASSLDIALSSSASANSFFNRAFSASSTLRRLASLALIPALGAPPAMPGRLGDLQVPQHLGEICACAQHPLALTDLANRLLRSVTSPLHCGHPPILGNSDPQHADSNQGPTSGLRIEDRRGNTRRGTPKTNESSQPTLASKPRREPLLDAIPASVSGLAPNIRNCTYRLCSS